MRSESQLKKGNLFIRTRILSVQWQQFDFLIYSHHAPSDVTSASSPKSGPEQKHWQMQWSVVCQTLLWAMDSSEKELLLKPHTNNSKHTYRQHHPLEPWTVWVGSVMGWGREVPFNINPESICLKSMKFTLQKWFLLSCSSQKVSCLPY